MKKLISLTFFILISVFGFSQDRKMLRGKVMYKNIAVPNENVINATTEEVTSTDNNGEFEIMAGKSDILAFSAVNYKFKTVNITDEILNNNRLVVEVNEKVTELDEVVVTPEDRERFIDLREEEFKKVDYEADESTEVINTALPESARGMEHGINFVNIFRAIVKSQKEEEETPVEKRIKVSQVLRQVYDDEFFVVDLKIPQDKIDDFLFYVDNKIPFESLIQDNDFALIDSLVNHSRSYLKISASEN